MARLTLVSESGHKRLDLAVADAAGISRSVAAKLIDAGAVSVNGARRGRSSAVRAGDRLEIDLPDPSHLAREPEPEAIPIPVVLEDRWLMIVSKPAGLVVHPAPGHPSGTLVNALLARAGRPAGGAAERPGIVHRLDAGTSGLMIVAKDQATHQALVERLAAREVSRTYLALVEGLPRASGAIDAPIGRSPKHRKKMAVVAGGREALTTYRRIEAFAGAALLEVSPLTGRTHQIRVHLAAAGHPVLGDRVYGRDRGLAAQLGLERPFLHAARLRFNHPMTGEPVDVEDPLPEDLARALENVRGFRARR